MNYILSFLFVLLCSFGAFAQITDTSQVTNQTALERESDSLKKIEEARLYKLNHTDFYVRRKGKLFGSFGLNQVAFGRSDIRLVGENYNLTLRGAVATDNNIGIGQHSFRLGYFINDKVSISLNRDRMSYVLTPNQVATIDGEVDPSLSAKYGKMYDNKLTEIKPDFISYSHGGFLDGYFVELDYNDLFFETYERNFAIDLVAGIGAGVAVTSSDILLLNSLSSSNEPQLSGVGFSANVGLKFYFFKYLYLHPTVKAGFMNLDEFELNNSSENLVSQSFTFFQFNTTVGFQFRLINK